MSPRENTHRSLLSQLSNHHQTVPPKARDGQYPHDQKPIGLDCNEAVDITSREYHEWCQRRCEDKRTEQANKTAYRSFVETHNARANVDPRERHCHSEYSNTGDQPCPYPLLKSTSFHSEDEDILFESPACPNDLAQRPSDRKPIPASTRGEASRETPLPFPHSARSEPPQARLTRTDTSMSTASNHSMSTVDSDDPLGEAYKNYEVDSKIVKDFDHYSQGWRHRFHCDCGDKG